MANATHIAEVSVDAGDGRVEIEGYTVVHDCGRVINPMIVDGQVVAAPVFDHQGRLVASVAILGRSGTMDAVGPDTEATALREASDEVSRQLGHATTLD